VFLQPCDCFVWLGQVVWCPSFFMFSVQQISAWLG
jgi:hypothetical protein